MKQQTTNLFFVLAFFSLLLFSFASATLTTISPTTSSVLSGDEAFLNASSDSLTSIMNCSWYAKSTSTANSSYVLIKLQANETTEATYINSTFDSSLLQDSNDYQFYSVCYNDTANETSAVLSSITIDNTIPQAPSSLSPVTGTLYNKLSEKDITFSATVSGANTTGCTLYFVGTNPGSSSYTMTHTGDTCTYSLTNTPESTYSYYITASDGTNSTSSSTLNFQYRLPSTKAPVTTTTPTTPTTSTDGGIPPVLIIVVVIGILGLLYYFIKK